MSKRTRHLYDDTHDTDPYDAYAEALDPLHTDRKARRKRKPRQVPVTRHTQPESVTSFADPSGLEGGFQTTYQPGKYEATWLLQSLRPFYDLNLITDVLAQVKGGKEASVYRCQAHPSTGFDLVAAKVYRPRMFRQLRNDSAYRAGREVLTADGKAVGKDALRVERAMTKKSSYGEQVKHTSWLMYEFTTLQRLHALGLPVPLPIQSAENALLMGYVGDGQTAAPTLSQVSLEPDEAQPLLRRTLDAIETMLRHGLAHGDLSAYNILYWEGEITLIDFPQVINPQRNEQGRDILTRDITRVCEYFAAQGAQVDAEAIATRLWDRYCAVDGENRRADESRLLMDAAED